MARGHGGHHQRHDRTQQASDSNNGRRENLDPLFRFSVSGKIFSANFMFFGNHENPLEKLIVKFSIFSKKKIHLHLKFKINLEKFIQK